MAARILIIDHQMHRLELLEAVLLKAGYEVALTTSGADALAASTTAAYDLVLLDMHLPAGESLSTYQALRAQPQTQALPLLLLTDAPAAYWQRLAYATSPPVVVSGDVRDHTVVAQRVQWMLQESGNAKLRGRKNPDTAEALVAPIE